VSSDHPMSLRFMIALVLSVVYLTVPACSAKTNNKRDVSVETAEALSKSAAEGNAPTNDLSNLAEAGNADAQNRLGLLYHDGQGVPVNYERAKHWFRKAA
jgi:TPR repeat protein